MQSKDHFQVADRPARLLSVALFVLLLSSVAGAAGTTNIQGAILQQQGAEAIGSITISWPAFTTASNDQVPAGNLTRTIGPDGHLEVDLIPNVGALPAAMVYTAEYQLKDGSSRREYWLVPARPRVTLAEVRSELALPAPVQESPQPAPQANVPPANGTIDRHAEIETYGLQAGKQRSPAPPMTHYSDTSPDHRGDFFHDPARNAYSNSSDSWLQVCNFTSHPGWNVGGTGWTGTGNSCLRQFEFNSAPGIDLGNPAVGPGGWSVHKGLTIDSTVNSPGISEIISGGQIKAGIGDTTGFYFYNHNYGGAVARSDEGNHLTAALGGEQATVYTGNVTKGGNGATSLKVHCTADCLYPGDGRYLVDTQQPVATGYATGKTDPDGTLTPGTFTVDASVTPSTAWGTLAADVVTPVAAQIGTGYTNMTLSVNVTHGRFAPGSLVCFGGQFHEQAIISSVTGSSPATITVPLRHAHESGSWIMQGGPCGTFIEFTANTVTPGTQKIRYPIDILGATDPHTLVYRFFALSSGNYGHGYWAGNVTFFKVSATHLSNNNGLVTMAPANTPAQRPEIYNAASVFISNAANPSFNGVCNNTKITPAGQLSCSQTSSTGATSATAEVSYGTSASGNTAFNLWSGAEVLDVLDLSVSPPAVNGTFTVEPNSAAWANNDSVENVHHYAAFMDAQHLTLSIYNPMRLSSQARVLGLLGPGISGGNPAQPTFYAADRIANLEATSNYAYHGGTVTPPGGIYLGGAGTAGLFNYGLAMEFAPDPPGSSAFYIGCPSSGCGDTAFYYSFFTLQGNGGSSSFNYTPATNILSLSGKGLNLKNEPLIGSTLQSENSGDPANLKFSSIDSSGNPHTWILNAPTTGGGVTLNLPQANGTLALNSAFGASGPNHSAGMVPDPGANPGAARFLREDGKWVPICRQEDTALTASLRPAVLRFNSVQDDTPVAEQQKFPAVVAHASREAQAELSNIINYIPESDGTFRLTVSVFIESPCDSGALSVNAELSPVAGHRVGQPQNPACTASYANTTSTITAHAAAGVPINAGVGFNKVNPGSLRYIADVILEQLQ